MRILFMGTTDFAVCCLDALVKAGHEIAAVCTKTDRPKNRGMKMVFSPVKEYALAASIPVLQPESLKDGETQEALRTFGADLFVVVAYGKLLPRAVLDMPRLGCINVHASLLPKYRGAAPIQWAVLNGEKETGVSVMYLAEEMDAGDVISADRLEIRAGEPFGSVYERLKPLGSELLLRTIPDIESGKARAVPQDSSFVTFAPPIRKEDTLLDFSLSPERLCGYICGFDPKPGARAKLGDAEYKLFSPAVGAGNTDQAPGTIVSAGKDGLELACGGGTVLIHEIQAPGGKRMPVGDYLRGHSLP